MNPCRCGYFGSSVRKCTCSEIDRKKYLSKLSGPLLDRIDIEIEVPAVTYRDMTSKSEEEDSEKIRERVIAARRFARERYSAAGEKTLANADLTPMQIRRYCSLGAEAASLMAAAFDKLGMSARGHDRILRVARTIADLEQREDIEAGDIAQALQFRSLDKKYWG